MTIHLTDMERKTLDWLKETGWTHWGTGEPYYSDIMGYDVPSRMEIPEKQIETILLGLIQKGLIKVHECTGWDSKEKQEVVGLLLYPVWRTYDFYGELDDEHIKYEFGGHDPREKDDEEPLTHAMRVSPFMKEYTDEMESLQRGVEILNVNGNSMGRAMWNLQLSMRDLCMWTGYDQRTGEIRPGGPHIRPNNSWSIKDVKAYFGLTGTSTYDPENPTENVMFSFLRLYQWVYPKPASSELRRL